jgi:glycosyltransferase involved in cell wall biosynthesis
MLPPIPAGRAAMKRRAVFAIPGDIQTRTGGYIYERQLLLALRRGGRAVEHLALPGSYPAPTPADLAATADALAAIPPGTPVLLDGFLSGATEPSALARMRAPYVPVTHHPLALETGLDPARAAHLHRVEAANLARAAHVVVPSPHTASVLSDGFGVAPERITVAPPGIVRPDLRPGGALRGTGPLRLLAVGQLVPRKGHDVLLRALARLRALDWTAMIVGGAPDADCAAELRALRDGLGLAGRVRFAGEVSQDALAQHYAEAGVFALATRYEGYGMVFAEALLHGLPIVTCAGGAVPDTVPEGTGLLVPPDDVPAYADALGRVIADAGLRASLTDAANAAGARLPTWDDTAAIVDAVLDRVAGGAPA